MAGIEKECYSLYMHYTPILTICPRCRSVMSSDAAACPGCGYVSSGVRSSRRSTIGSLTVVFGVSGLLLVVIQDSQITDQHEMLTSFLFGAYGYPQTLPRPSAH
jgi:hypothetical protein